MQDTPCVLDSAKIKRRGDDSRGATEDDDRPPNRVTRSSRRLEEDHPYRREENGRGEKMSGSPAFAAATAEEDASLVDFIKISSKEEPRHYSAKIAWNARNNSHMPLLATGAPAINCAIKAVAIARRLLEEDSLELFVQPAFRDRSMANSLALYVSSKSKRATEGLIQNASELTAGKGSKPTVIAGAISNRAREGGCPNITGIGPEAVCNAIMAVCHARLYLEQDQLDIRVIPAFQEVEKEDRSGDKHTMTAVKLQVVVEKV